MTTVELIKSIAFDFGWTVSTDEEEDTVVFDFRYYTKHGLDYGFCAELTGNKFRRADRKQIWRVSWGCGAVLRGL